MNVHHSVKIVLFIPEDENSKLLTELDKESKEVARLTVVESEVQQLKVELDEVQAKLKSTALELGKTQARNKTMERHGQVRFLSQLHVMDSLKKFSIFYKHMIIQELSTSIFSCGVLLPCVSYIGMYHPNDL